MKRELVAYGFTAFNGKTWHDSQVDSYNTTQSRINSFIGDGRNVPESLLNDSHKQFCMFSGLI